MEQDSPTPFVSVVIPVYNDAARLRRCLAALAAQSYPRGRYEAIVVDNGSSDGPDAAAAGLDFVVLAHEARPGSYAARNAGIALARGAVLAFTDADCVPEADWIARGVARLLADPPCDIAAGAVMLFVQDPARPTAAELYESLMAFPQQKYVEQERYGATANLFAWRRVAEQIGPFDAALASGGDREWGQRAHGAGLTLAYAEGARVGHPARRSFGELARKIVRVTGGIERLRARRRPSPMALAKAVARDLLPPPGRVRRIWADRRLRGAQRLRVIAVLVGLRWAQAGARIGAHIGLQLR